VETGTASAFVTTKEDPEINQPTIDYVASFVPNETGRKFNPHVTIGIASQDYLKKMLDEKFEAFTFSPAKAPVYHLDNFGTARRLPQGCHLLRRNARTLGAEARSNIVCDRGNLVVGIGIAKRRHREQAFQPMALGARNHDLRNIGSAGCRR
jgi:hypothetical protein